VPNINIYRGHPSQNWKQEPLSW